MKKLSILSIGAGAIGTYVGGSLALNGHEVVFLERPEIAEDLKTRGLKLLLDDQEHHIPLPQMVTNLDQVLASHKFDLALFALKSFDTPLFLSSLTHLQNLPPILCLSNGVDNETLIAKALGQDRVIAGTVTTAIGRRNPGDIKLEKLRGVGVSAGHTISKQIVAALDESGLNAQIFPRSDDMKWSKMLTNLIANASSAILNMTPGEIFSNPDLYQLEIAQLRETLSVMKAQRIGVVDLPGTPVKALAFAVRSLPLALSRPLLGRAVGGGRGEKMPSFHIDLHSGRGNSEVDYLNGAVVRAGEKAGIPTPANKLLTDTLLQLTHGEYSLRTFDHQPQKLLSLF
ncbi:MAG: 2-dehydropantoate 2-reductase [Chloroflexi bacterium]|nr:2-dehydropantoate 2-reductase [Chloroflexota bacterium]